MRGRVFSGVIILVIISFLAQAEVIRPVAVSPGSELEVLVVESTCPTFSWGAVAWASSYQLVVYELMGQAEGILYYEDFSLGRQPVLEKKIEGGALSWTPSRGESLEPGVEYVWFVGADDGSGSCVWSVGKRFRVEISRGELPEKKVKDKIPGRGVGLEETEEPVSKQERGGVLGRLEKRKALAKASSLPTNNKVNTSVSKFIALGSENDGNGNVYYGYGAGNNLTSDSEFNSLFGYYAGYSLNDGDCNCFFGSLAGSNNTEGGVNTFIGCYSGFSNTIGNGNTFIGVEAGYYNTTASANTFFGFEAGYYNTTGYSNIFLGYKAGCHNTTGYSNTFIGYKAGYNNTEATDNIFLGYQAGYSNTSGYYNVFIGDQAGAANTEGDYNTFLGYMAGNSNSTGSRNTFIGYYSGVANTTGQQNVFLGYDAGMSNTTGNCNTFLGYRAGYSNTEGLNNLFVGYQAGNANTTGNYNTFLGYYAGASNTTGSENLFLGYYTGGSNTTGSQNTFLGYLAGFSTTEGTTNTFVGYRAGYSNTTGSGNLFLGYKAGYNETGSNKLYLANSDTSSPLIYGEFDNTLVRINGDFQVTGGFSLDGGTTYVTDIVTGSANNDKLVTQGYVDDHAGGNNINMTDQYIGKWDEASGKLVDTLVTASELNLLDGMTGIAKGSSQNDKLVTKGYVDESDDVGLTGSAMSDQYLCKWNSSNSRLENSIIHESDGAAMVDGPLTVTATNINVETTENRARFRLLAAGGNYFNFTARNDFNDVTLSVWDASGSQWLPMLSYEYYNNKIDFKDNDLVTTGSISKGSGTFDIPHPDPAKKEAGWRLRHSFVESPTAGDNLYRYQVKVVGGQAVIKLPEYFKYLNENPQGWVSPVDVLGVARIEVDLEEARIYATVDGTYNVLIIGTRKDETAVRNWEKYGVEYQKGDTTASHKE
ncbi:MAG: hypothetical protein J7L26_11040 [Candidatus Aminicenantes bacterium]|nr:hypothetical protein [Candidatus Aminicenantes bacterium]